MACNDAGAGRPGREQLNIGLPAMEQPPPAGNLELVESMVSSIRLGKWTLARDLAVSAAVSDHPDIRSLAVAGRILEILGEWPEASVLYRRFAGHAPTLLYPQFRLCHVLADGGRQSAELERVLATLVGRAPANPRIAALKAQLSMQGGADVPEPFRAGLWRRWFASRARWHEGAAVGRSDMAVVVIGFRGQPGLRRAVESLLGQDEKVEIVVVNSGGGDVRALLARHSEVLRIIDIEQPLYVGAARNVGIDATAAPYVAFLAGDCVARPGWVETRLATHRKGARAVASAMVAADDGDLSLAAHIALFGARSPQVPAVQALRYGASYDRQVFREFGYFDPALRVGEDTDFAKRLGRRIHPAWNPRVQTEHAGPASLWRFVVEMYGRGRRAANGRSAGIGPLGPRAAIREILAEARRRNGIADTIALQVLKVDPRRLAGLRCRLRPATLAYGIGLVMGRRELRATHRGKRVVPSGQASDAASARSGGDGGRLDMLLDAADRWLLETGGEEKRETSGCLDEAARAAAFDEAHLQVLAEWLIRHGRHQRAWLLGDRVTIDLPSAAKIHHRLALAAHEAGDIAAFELAALDALARDPDIDGLWPLFQSVFPRTPSAPG
jgi:hypothetical protein